MKAVLLSALVLPGLGQLYKGERGKGIILILLVNLFVLASLFLILKAVGPTLVMSHLSGTLSSTELLEQLQKLAPAGRWILASFVGLWLFGVVDAARSRKSFE